MIKDSPLGNLLKRVSPCTLEILIQQVWCGTQELTAGRGTLIDCGVNGR